MSRKEIMPAYAGDDLNIPKQSRVVTSTRAEHASDDEFGWVELLVEPTDLSGGIVFETVGNQPDADVLVGLTQEDIDACLAGVLSGLRRFFEERAEQGRRWGNLTISLEGVKWHDQRAGAKGYAAAAYSAIRSVLEEGGGREVD